MVQIYVLHRRVMSTNEKEIRYDYTVKYNKMK